MNMETIDFMGLADKQETSDETIIHAVAPVRRLAMQWSFSNKGSADPQLLSFKASQDERPKTGFDSLASTGLITITTSTAFAPDHKPYTVSPKDVVSEKQGGIRYTVMNHSIHRPITNQTNHAAMPSNNSPVVGTTDLRSSPKIAAGPAQLTIFYNGSVCVYDNISPEKAQAIMLLAGNAPPMTSSATPPPPPPPVAPVQVPMLPKSSVFDGFVINQPYGATQHRSSVSPITSIGISQFAARPPAANNNKTAVRPVTILESSVAIAEPLRVVRPATGTSLSSGSVPQFRRKSLARFFEKRKERVISATPYADKQSTEAGGTSLSTNSSGSCPVLTIN